MHTLNLILLLIKDDREGTKGICLLIKRFVKHFCVSYKNEQKVRLFNTVNKITLASIFQYKQNSFNKKEGSK